jgi:hypothetical protein
MSLHEQQLLEFNDAKTRVNFRASKFEDGVKDYIEKYRTLVPEQSPVKGYIDFVLDLFDDNPQLVDVEILNYLSDLITDDVVSIQFGQPVSKQVLDNYFTDDDGNIEILNLLIPDYTNANFKHHLLDLKIHPETLVLEEVIVNTFID